MRSIQVFEDVSLDEVIELPKFNFTTITLDQIKILQEALKRKPRQEQFRKEYKERHVLYEVKEIFLKSFDIMDVNEEKPSL